MKRIGLTGNIGSGKSTVARIFEILGVPVYHADIEARKILESKVVSEKVASLFGNNILNASHQINRKALAAIVFNDKEKLTLLNELIHPLVKEDFIQWCNHHRDKAYILHEAAILFESGFNRLFDSNILVVAPEELCISRVISRDHSTKEMVVERMQNQWSQEKKQALAEYQVLNDENTLVIPQILMIHENILSR